MHNKSGKAVSTMAGSPSDGSQGRAPRSPEWKEGVGQEGAQAFQEQSRKRRPSRGLLQSQVMVPAKLWAYRGSPPPQSCGYKTGQEGESSKGPVTLTSSSAHLETSRSRVQPSQWVCAFNKCPLTFPVVQYDGDSRLGDSRKSQLQACFPAPW